MGILDFFLTGFGLSMDAFAVAVCKGLAMRKVNRKQCFIIALFFGGFQAIMPLLGYLIGSTFARYIKQIDHWIAFALLLYIGGKMIIEAVREKDEEIKVEKMDPPLDYKELLMMAVATSIDALAIGVTYSFMNVDIIEAVSVIGLTTFVISGAGVYIGNIFGTKFEKKAQILGGAVLVFLGVRILVTHLMGLG